MKRLILSFLILGSLTFPLFAAPGEEGPILDQASLRCTSLPPVYLDDCNTQEVAVKKILARSFKNSEKGKDLLRKMSRENCKSVDEFWWCIDPHSELGKSYMRFCDINSLKPSEQKEVRELEGKGVNITVTRHYLGSAEAALEWAKLFPMRLMTVRLAEGSYSGQAIGDQCWSFKPDPSMREEMKE